MVSTGCERAVGDDHPFRPVDVDIDLIAMSTEPDEDSRVVEVRPTWAPMSCLN